MLKIENVEVSGWEAAIRGMRNPMNSWEKSDSGYGCGDQFDIPDIQFCSHCASALFCNAVNTHYVIGKNDLDLMKRLAKGGSVHAKYRRMINVTMDITAPLYWWKEYDTYKVGTVANSCSTMHKIQEKEFTLDDVSHEHLDNRLYICVYVPNPDGDDIPLSSLDLMKLKLKALNFWRAKYNDTVIMLRNGKILSEVERKNIQTAQKDFWWQMIQLLPSSYNQRRTVQLNYEVLSHLYFDRKDHKLDCWHTFCDVIRSLPYAKEIITMED